ncbi:MAG: non-canonical purine NTP pyrophosphatase [Alphaproteobacteria bacterium]
MRNVLEVLRDGLVLATHNAGKLVEMRDLVAPLGVPVTSAGERGLPEPEETGDSFVANARLKAEAARDATGLAAVGDDSGLVVPAIGGAPGIHSARWAGPARDFAMAMDRLNRAVCAAGPARDAYFISVVVLALPDGREQVFEGRVDGTLVWPPRGDGGFGYDPMFVPEGEDPAAGRSFAEMPFAAKQAISHRGRAIRAFLAAVSDA